MSWPSLGYLKTIGPIYLLVSIETTLRAAGDTWECGIFALTKNPQLLQSRYKAVTALLFYQGLLTLPVKRR